jgi:hypothetical protein
LSGDQPLAILDLDHDTRATNKDLQVLITAMASGTLQAAVVPEPTSFELAVISFIGIARLHPSRKERGCNREAAQQPRRAF